MTLYTTKSAAQVLGLTQRRVRQLIEDGSLPVKRYGHEYLIDEDDLGILQEKRKRARRERRRR